VRNITEGWFIAAPPQGDWWSQFVVRRLLAHFADGPAIIVDKQNPRTDSHTPRMPGQIFKLLFQPRGQGHVVGIHPRQIRAARCFEAGVESTDDAAVGLDDQADAGVV